MFRLLGALSLGCVIACGPTHDHGDTTGATLSIDPPTSELLIVNGEPAKEAFTATLVYQDGEKEDVTDDVTFSIDSNFGDFAGPVVQVRSGGKTQVFGVFKDVSGTAEITARVKSVRVDPSLPPNTPDLFTGPEDPALAPTVLYPPADVLMPRNVGDFETHWTDGKNDIFEVSLKTEFADVRVYTPGNNGVGGGPRPSFVEFKAEEWTSAVGVEKAVQYQVRGVSTAAPGPVGAAAPRTVNVPNEVMEGGIYYWAAASDNGVYGIYRHDMAKPGLPAEEYMTTNQTAGRCVACHVLSRDGTQMAITYDGGNGAASKIDIRSGMEQPITNNWNFATFTPDNTQLFTVFNGAVTVRDASNLAPITTMPASGYVSHPDLSPDGVRLTYIITPSGGADWSFAGGHVFTRTYDPVTHTFGAETPLVTDGVNNFYPSWSPDGEWILFNRSDSGTSYNNGNASLWVVKADGSAPPVELAIANAGLGLTNSWGRWAPFEQTVGANGDKIYWITVSSKRDFGVRLVGAQRPQIWMTPFFPGRAAQAQDPSVVAFRLPFQNITSNNHIAQWTEKVVVTQ